MKTRDRGGPAIVCLARCVARLGLLSAGLAWIAIPLSAAVTIVLPEIILLPDQAGQSFAVYVENTGDPLAANGIGLNVQVADGGPAAGGTIRGPAITAVDLLTGTIFATNNNGPSGIGSITPQVYVGGTLSSSGTVSLPNGRSKVATITLDTTGFSSGTFAITLRTLNGPTKYTTSGDDYYPTLIDGQVTVGARPFITGMVRPVPTRVALTFSTTAGLLYRAQRAPSLTAGGWTHVSHALTADDPLVLEVHQATGTVQTIFVESPPGASVFYRVSMERREP
jgi:hypothetical protein